jgi:hypothetical protein
MANAVLPSRWRILKPGGCAAASRPEAAPRGRPLTRHHGRLSRSQPCRCIGCRRMPSTPRRAAPIDRSRGMRREQLPAGNARQPHSVVWRRRRPPRRTGRVCRRRSCGGKSGQVVTAGRNGDVGTSGAEVGLPTESIAALIPRPVLPLKGPTVGGAIVEHGVAQQLESGLISPRSRASWFRAAARPLPALAPPTAIRAGSTSGNEASRASAR